MILEGLTTNKSISGWRKHFETKESYYYRKSFGRPRCFGKVWEEM
jgi:hypothetical protein